MAALRRVQFALFAGLFLLVLASCYKNEQEQRKFSTNKFVILTMAIEEFKQANGRPPKDLEELKPAAERLVAKYEKEYLDQSWSGQRLELYQSGIRRWRFGVAYGKCHFFEYHFYPETGDYVLFLRLIDPGPDECFPETGPPSLQLLHDLDAANAPESDSRSKYLFCHSFVAFDGEIIHGVFVNASRQSEQDKRLKGEVLPKLLQPYKWSGWHTYSY